MGAAAVQQQPQPQGLLVASARVVPELTFLSQRPVQLHLNQPLLGLGDITPLVTLCAIADAHVEKAVRLNSVDFFDESVLAAVEAECERIRPGHPITETLQVAHLAEYFPYLQQCLTCRTLQPVRTHAGAGYLVYISLLNQAVMVASQVYHEASQPSHHKYIAHQLALLYQSLNQLAGDTKPIRRAIEGKFESIKEATESRYPYLDLDTSSWLQRMAFLSREEIRACPPYIHKRLIHMLKTVQQKPSTDKL